MRPLERWMAVLAAVLGVSLIASHEPMPLWGKAVLLTALLCLPVHAWLEGMHWQLWPLYLATLLAGRMLLPVAVGSTAPIGYVVLTLVAMSLTLSWAMPMFKLPRPTGEYPVGTRTLYLTDPSREEMHAGASPGQRELVVQLWYPAATRKGRRACYRDRRETTTLSRYQAVLRTHSLQDAPLAARRSPVLLFNHAWTGFRNRTTFLAQEMASHGFVVVAISHPYNASIVAFNDGRVVRAQQMDIGFYSPVAIPLAQRQAIADEELRIQTDDCAFVLDTLERLNASPGDPLEGKLDLARVGAYGYSYGGAVSAELALEDRRVRCALELDGVLHGAAAVDGLSKPLMTIDSSDMTLPAEPPHGLDTVAQSKYDLFAATIGAKQSTLSRHGGYRVYIEGMNHENFADSSFMSPLRRLSKGGPIAPARAAEILGAYMVAFFRETLLGRDEELLREGVKVFPEATLTIFAAPVAKAEV